MTSENGRFKASDQTDIFYQCWLPETEPKAALVVVHGVAEHSGRYMNLVNSLVPKGFSVYGLDHYGHGKSGGKRLYVPDFNIFTDCLDHLVSQVKAWEKDKPVFLVGHSMGGLITCAYLLSCQHKVNGAILSGASVKIPGHVTPLTIWAARFFSKVLPTLGIKDLEVSDISRDPAVVQAYINDPLVSTGKVTARLAEQLLRACNQVTAGFGTLSCPLLILHGQDDALVEAQVSKDLYQGISSSDKKLILYPKRFHEIFNDPDHDQVFSDMIEWLEERV